MVTIFYSWQSDIPSNINRNFIKEALEEAIKNASESLNLEDAPRLDQDTSSLPGSPEIVNSILKKIDECSIFVPDLTFVGHTDTKKAIPNPNVLIEYGYALNKIGPERIIAVINEGFGIAANLPFDLKHRRWPISYGLTPKNVSEKYAEQKNLLTSKLKSALQTAAKADLFNTSEEPTKQVQSKWLSSSFLDDSEIIAKNPRTKEDIIWFNGPQAFLRVIPTTSLQMTPLQLTEISKPDWGLLSFGIGSYWPLMNKNGFVVACGEKKADAIHALSLTQVFRNGEIWGIDREILTDKYIPAEAIEALFNKTFINYLVYSRNVLKLKLPLKYVLGLSGIEGYAISTGSSRVEGNCVDPEILHTGNITDYDASIPNMLIPFFENIWESCGFHRPQTLK